MGKIRVRGAAALVLLTCAIACTRPEDLNAREDRRRLAQEEGRAFLMSREVAAPAWYKRLVEVRVEDEVGRARLGENVYQYRTQFSYRLDHGRPFRFALLLTALSALIFSIWFAVRTTSHSAALALVRAAFAYVAWIGAIVCVHFVIDFTLTALTATGRVPGEFAFLLAAFTAVASLLVILIASALLRRRVVVPLPGAPTSPEVPAEAAPLQLPFRPAPPPAED